MKYDVIIIGAGAAGLMCAAEAGKRGRRVLLLDHAAKVGKKIRIAGGGRCNFTNIHTTPKNFLSQNPRFAISALSRYTPQDFIDLVEQYKIAYHEKTLGQLFCDGSAQQIIDMLVSLCTKGRVEIRTNCQIHNVARNEHYTITTSMGEFTAPSLVIATGGLSIPKMGATGFGYQIAKQFGIPLVQTKAALVPFMFTDTLLEKAVSLAGVSTPDAVVTYQKTKFQEGILFTHRGMSGPSVLQISSYWDEGNPVRINFVPQVDVLDALLTAKEKTPRQEAVTVLSTIIPKRFAVQICKDIAGRKLAECSNTVLRRVASEIQDWQVTPHTTEGYRTAEVTLGGVDTTALSSQTMEAKDMPGLYFIGEVVDVTGHLGGFNFQWAWASGVAAGQCV